jgi:hypothetical protein
VCRKEEPRQLQAEDLDTIINHRMPQAIRRYENLVDSIDTFQKLRVRDLCVNVKIKIIKTKHTTLIQREAHPTLKFQGICRRKLYNLASRVIPLHTNNLARMVQPNLTHRWRKVRRIDRRRPKIVRRNWYAALHRRPALENESNESICVTQQAQRAGMAHRFGGNVEEGPVAVAVGSSGDGDTADSHGVGSSARR